MDELHNDDKRKYALAMRRVELGMWGHPISTYRAIHLTTREGDDNTPQRFGKDIKGLVKSFRKEGYKVEYSGAMGYTPQKSLLHWHGLFRIKGGYFLSGDIRRARRILGDRWKEEHGAFVVQITRVHEEDTIKKYINKHIMKDYAEAGFDNRLLTTSRGWRARGWESIVREVKEWYLNGTYVIWLDRRGWKIVGRVIEAYVKKSSVYFKAEFGHLWILHGKIKEAVIYGFDEYGRRIE